MEKLWTGPVKWSVALSAACVAGTGACVWIGLQSLDVAKSQLAVAQKQAAKAVASLPTTPGSGPVTINYTPFIIAAALAVLSLLMLIGTVVYIARRSKSNTALRAEWDAEVEVLRNEIADQTNAKNDREGRLNELRKEYDQLKAKINTTPQANPGFHIVSANWGNEHSSARLDDVINALPLNAIAFHLSPSTFKPYTTADKADPAFGSPKFLDIVCSFPGQAIRKFRRYEGDIVVLPPDPRAFRELEDHAKEISNLKAIRNAPRLLIKFSVDERSPILFVNDDSPTFQNVELTDVKIRIDGPGKEEWSEFNLPVNLHGSIGILRSGEQIDVGYGVRSGSTWMKMVEAIRKHSSPDKTTKASLAAIYEDMEGNKFWRKFELNIDPLSRVAVTASPVKVAASEPYSWAVL